MNLMKAASLRLLFFVGIFSLVSVSFTAGDAVKREDLQQRFQGPVFLYSGEPGVLPYPCVYDSFHELAAIPQPREIFSLQPSSPNPRKGGGGLEFSSKGKAGPERLKRLSQCLHEGGLAWTVAASGSSCYVGTSGSLDCYDVTDATTPVLMHRIQETASDMIIEGNLMAGIVGCQSDLVLYDLSDPHAPSEISRLSPPEGFYYKTLTMNGSLVAAMGNGNLDGFGWSAILQLVDISNLQAPEVISTLLAISTFYRAAVIEDDYLYLTIDGQGLAVFDISDPMYFIQVGFSAIYPYVDSMVYEDDYLFCAGHGLEVVDVSDPYEPELVAQLGGPYTSDIRLSNDIAYITDDDDYSLRIIDVSDPINPQTIVHHPAYGTVWRLDLFGDKVCLADRVYGLIVLDVTNPASPDLDSITSTGVRPMGADVEDGLAVITSNLARVHAVDVSDPYAPQELGVYVPIPDTAPGNTDAFHGLDLEGDMAAISDNDWGVALFDLTDPNLPEPVGKLQVGGEYNPVVQYNGLILTGLYQLLVFDITDPQNPVQVGTGPDFPKGIYDINIVGETCYVAGYDEVAIIDITNPLSMTELSRFSPSPEIEHIGGIEVENVLLGLYGLTWTGIKYFFSFSLYDVSNPSAPMLLSFTKYPPEILTLGAIAGTTNLAVDKGIFYACSWDNLVAIDASDPMNPLLAAKYAEPNYMTATGAAYEGVFCMDGLIYLTGHHGLEILRFLDVGLFLTPEIDPVIVKQGESFTYELKIENFTTEPQTVLAEVEDPFPSSGSQAPQSGSFWMTLQPSERAVYTRTVAVPATAPTGTYHLNGTLFGYPKVQLDDHRITFEVVTD